MKTKKYTQVRLPGKNQGGIETTMNTLQEILRTLKSMPFKMFLFFTQSEK